MLKKVELYEGRLQHLVTRDGVALLMRSWKGAKNAPTVFIGHTQATHSGHFLDLANALNGLGWNVFSGDLRGHGNSTGTNQKHAHLEPESGWDNLISDMELLVRHAFKEVPFEQRVLATHNISGLLTLELLKRDCQLARHIILSVPAKQKITALLSRAFVKARMKVKPVDEPDEHTTHHLYTFTGARLKNKKHLADVMSGDRELVKTIVEDPLGFPTPTLGYWSSVFQGNDEAWNWPGGKKINEDIRFLLMHGSEDFMSNGGYAKPVVDWLRKAGAKEISYSRVEGARTAILLDERSLGISNIIAGWVGEKNHADCAEAMNDIDFETMSRNIIDTIANSTAPDNPLKTDELVALCYEAIDDENRWVEIIYRLSLDMAGKENLALEEFENHLQTLMPHWDRSYKINKQLMSNAALGVVLQSVIERLDIGTALIANDQTVIYSNNAFDNTLRNLLTEDEQEPNFSTSDRFRLLLDDEFVAKLKSDQPEMVLVHDGHPVGYYFKPEALRLVARQNKSPSGLLILRSSLDVGISQSGTRLSMIELAYGLTTQEATVALEIANGLGPVAIAEKLAVSINTIRTHLKRGYEKMGVDGQTEMASRIMSGPIGWLAK